MGERPQCGFNVCMCMCMMRAVFYVWNSISWNMSRFVVSAFAKSAVETDGEAAQPGPRSRGRRSRSATLQRRRERERRAAAAAVRRAGCWVEAEAFEDNFVVMHVNIRGLLGKLAELSARIRLMPVKPQVVCINETWLDQAAQDVPLEGYVEIARRDRVYGDDDRKCGGIMVLARADVAKRVTLLSHSKQFERSWMLVHSDRGGYLLCAWYRPPCAGEVASINALQEEIAEHSRFVLGTVIVADCNVHQRSWLRFSSQGNTIEGARLWAVCNDLGLQQKVNKPTRGDNLLDLVLTDVADVKCDVEAPVADHAIVLVKMNLALPKSRVVQRQVWDFKRADWDALNEALGTTDWSFLDTDDADRAAAQFTEVVLDVASGYIEKRVVRERKSVHPWVNDVALDLVARKRDAVGTAEEAEATNKCTEGLKAEFDKFVEQTKVELGELPRGSKQWWSKTRDLLRQKTKSGAVPALRSSDGAWVMEAVAKADLFAKMFGEKYGLAGESENRFTTLCVSPYVQPSVLRDRVPGGNAHARGLLSEVDADSAQHALSSLRVDSATGPDMLPTRVLRFCACALALPVARLASCILRTGRWPETWIEHWIVPLYKRKVVYDPGNYRGVHLTAQISKVVERMLSKRFVPHLCRQLSFGPNQFAYQKERGARDALAYLTLSWFHEMCRRMKVGVYCSDVSGAFDRVCLPRLVAKLQAAGLCAEVVSLLSSWLRKRVARVVVEGDKSAEMELANMVFQGTVWGCILWNVFYADSRRAIEETGHEEIVYADDLNAWKVYGANVANGEVMAESAMCQANLHEWGGANRVSFDPSKESKHVLSFTQPAGGNFRILGALYDPSLAMKDAVVEVAAQCRWKLQTLLRSRRFYCDADMVMMYKSHVLSYIEYKTPALYHACATVLADIDVVQRRFMSEIGISEIDALMAFRLAPLRTRRDIAMMGVIHRAALGKGPVQLKRLFPPACQEGRRSTRAAVRHSREREITIERTQLCGIERSAFGLARVYNMLPQWIVDAEDVSVFQSRLQYVVKGRAAGGCADWADTFSPRLPRESHPARRL